MINIIPCNELQAEAQRLCDLFEPCYQVTANDLDALTSLAYSSSLCVDPNAEPEIDQNNIFINYVTTSSDSDISTAFDNSVQLEINEKQLVNIIHSYIGTAPNTPDLKQYNTDYYFFKLGKGTYGLGSNITTANTDFIKYRETYNVSLPSTDTLNEVEVIELEHTDTLIPEQIVNSGTYEIEENKDYYFIIKNTSNSQILDKRIYRFLNEPGTYGSSNNTLNADYLLVDSLSNESDNFGYEGYKETGSIANNNLNIKIGNGSTEIEIAEGIANIENANVNISDDLTVSGNTSLNNTEFANVSSVKATGYTNEEIDIVGDDSLITKRYLNSNYANVSKTLYINPLNLDFEQDLKPQIVQIVNAMNYDKTANIADLFIRLEEEPREIEEEEDLESFFVTSQNECPPVTPVERTIFWKRKGISITSIPEVGDEMYEDAAGTIPFSGVVPQGDLNEYLRLAESFINTTIIGTINIDVNGVVTDVNKETGCL